MSEYSQHRKELCDIGGCSVLNPKTKERDTLIIQLYLDEKLTVPTLSKLSVLDVDTLDPLSNQEIRIVKRRRFQKIREETAKQIMKYLKVRGRYLPKTDILFVNNKGYKLSEKQIRSILRNSLGTLKRSELKK